MCSKFYLRSPLLRGLLTTGLLVATSCLIILFILLVTQVGVGRIYWLLQKRGQGCP